jgi:hypothetical protein
MKIRLSTTEKVTSKLMFVKILKNVTGLGLKESKDIVDYLCDNPRVSKDIDIKKDFIDYDGNVTDSVRYLREELPNCGGNIIFNGAKEYERELKMLSLGIGDKDDYYSFLMDYIDINKEFIINILSKLEKEDLQKLIKEINYDSYL